MSGGGGWPVNGESGRKGRKGPEGSGSGSASFLGDGPGGALRVLARRRLSRRPRPAGLSPSEQRAIGHLQCRALVTRTGTEKTGSRTWGAELGWFTEFKPLSLGFCVTAAEAQGPGRTAQGPR